MTAKDVTTTFRLPSELAEALRVHAERKEQSVSDVLRDAVLAVIGRCPTCGQSWRPAG
jgi:Arc/MetJ-type ribon-helix-helix transcriptional regulator